MSIHACAPVTNGVGKRVKDAVKRVGAAGGRARTLARVGDDDDDDEDDGSVTARDDDDDDDDDDGTWLALDGATTTTMTTREMRETRFGGARAREVLAVPVRARRLAAARDATASERDVVFAVRLRDERDGARGGRRRRAETRDADAGAARVGRIREDPGRDARWLFPARRAASEREGGSDVDADAMRAMLASSGSGGECARGPMVCRGYCSSAWSIERVREACDVDAVVDVHVCAERVIDLAGHRAPGTPRNFQFRKMAFGEFLDRVSERAGREPLIGEGERYYLRSVDGKARADVRRTHPGLARALELECVWPETRFHSSVLRISSSETTLQTHFDTHDNVLIQLAGEKEVTLFPPEVDSYMYVQGSSSRVNYPNNAPGEFPLFDKYAKDAALKIKLRPGDALFIPAFWFHHVYASGDGASVAVNVFFRTFEPSAYNPSDIYGNKDLVAGKEACDLASRAGSALDELPEPFRSFYARRAVKALANQLAVRINEEW
jgi:hypothetical protein|tara:strand:+ start:50 stop:1540 length:1491 start_codon:yes stop_codon:yes gene_type:complete